MKTKRISIRAAGALVALLSLFLFVAAACGDDGDDVDPTATEPAVEEPTATEPADAEPTDEPEPDPTATEPPAPVETSVDVSLTEFVLESSVDSVSAGSVTFNVSSNGAIFHNFRVVETDLAPDGLPTDDATFGVDESQVNIVGSTADLDPGDTEELTVELEAGSYVLICNIPTHYDLDMRIAFSVE